MSLITLEQAKAQLRVVHDEDDDEIQEIIDAASVAIIRYLKSSADPFLDTAGSVVTGAVPPDVQMACKMQVGEWYKNREGQTENDIGGVLGIPHGYGYLSRGVVALLYPLRVPTLA